MEETKEFYAFISYKREDEKWAKWLQDKLEHYKFPTNLNGRTDLPKNIRPTFRDVTDLEPGLLEERINSALHNSQWLIVVCSPRSAQSPWVCKEAQSFIDQGRADRIIPFVIEGTPFSNDTATECYPEALRNLTGSQELLAANINEMGRDAAVIKVVACMFSLRFDTLWQRHERQKRRRRNWTIAAVTAFVLAVLGVAGYILHLNNQLSIEKREALAAKRNAEEQRDRAESEKTRAEHAEDSIRGQNQLIIAQQASILQANRDLSEERNRLVAANNDLLIRESNIMAREAERIMDDNAYLAQRLALAALPTNLEHPDRPYVPTAERALRLSSYRHSGFIGPDTGFSYTFLHPIRIMGNYYKKNAPFDTAECVFEEVRNTIYQLDLINGTRHPIIEVPAGIIDYKAHRSYEDFYSLCGYPRIIVLQGDSTISFWELDDGKWIQYDTLYLTDIGMPSHIDAFQDKVICSYEHNIKYVDTTYILEKTWDEQWDERWVVIDRLIGGRCAIGTNNLATYSENDRKIYIWRVNNYCYNCTFTLTDTLETDEDNIYDLSLYQKGSYATLVASGDNGIHIYQRQQYGYGKDKIYCWDWTDLIKKYSWSKAAIKSSNEFYIPLDRERKLWHFKRVNVNGIYSWKPTLMENVRSVNIAGTMNVDLVDNGASVLVSDGSIDRLQYINPSTRRPLKEYRSKWNQFYYQDGNDILYAVPSMNKSAYVIGIVHRYKWIDTLYGHTDTIIQIRYSNGYLLSWSKDSTLRVWKRYEGKYRCIDSIHNAIFTEYGYAEISKDRSVASFKDPYTELFFVKNKANKWILTDSNNSFTDTYTAPAVISKRNAIAFSPSNTSSDITSFVPTVSLYYPQLNKRITLCPTVSKSKEEFMLSPIGNAIAGVPLFRESIISLYILEKDSVVEAKTLMGHDGDIKDINFSPDGKYMVSTAKDNTVRIWQIPSGECIEVISDAGIPQYAYFTEDGTRIIVVCKVKSGRNVYIYDFPLLQQLIDRTRNRFKETPLTPEERRKYYLK